MRFVQTHGPAAPSCEPRSARQQSKRRPDMTRETKLGLIVGTSFLSLAAVVAISHWNQPDPGPAEPKGVFVGEPPAKQGPSPSQNVVVAGLKNQDQNGEPKGREA